MKLPRHAMDAPARPAQPPAHSHRTPAGGQARSPTQVAAQRRTPRCATRRMLHAAAALHGSPAAPPLASADTRCRRACTQQGIQGGRAPAADARHAGCAGAGAGGSGVEATLKLVLRAARVHTSHVPVYPLPFAQDTGAPAQQTPPTKCVYARAQVLARALACAPDPSKYACLPGRPTNFYCLFSNTTSMPAQCKVRAAARAQAAGTTVVWQAQAHQPATVLLLGRWPVRMSWRMSGSAQPHGGALLCSSLAPARTPAPHRRSHTTTAYHLITSTVPP